MHIRLAYTGGYCYIITQYISSMMIGWELGLAFNGVLFCFGPIGCVFYSRWAEQARLYTGLGFFTGFWAGLDTMLGCYITPVRWIYDWI